MTLPLALIPVLRQTFIDANGATLSNGYVKFYEAGGTSTPQAVFADQDGNTSLGTTVQLDAAGQYVNGSSPTAVFLSPTGYTAVIYNSSNVVQWTQDFVEDVGSAFLSQSGVIQATGTTATVSPYVVAATDNTVFVNSATDHFVVTLPAAASRGTMLVIKNLSAVSVRATPAGAETIDGIAAYYTVPAAASPLFPAIQLLSDGVSAWTVIGGLGL